MNSADAAWISRRHVIAGGALAVLGLRPAHAASTACSPLLEREFARLQDEKPQNLCQYAGRVLLVVNTASFCGFTPQYRSLETLYQRYRGRGLVVLGFPSNDFGQQEPGSDRQIAEFCESTFGVRFPMFAKSRVAAAAGDAANPLFADLARRTGQWPRWNFHKYLVARDGHTVTSHPSEVDALDRTFVSQVEALLAAK
ncbi:glutathione peroxidase [uncultured Piscinibacter sp.]|uniref:glutathione peroxidase n=1 Tax=uncultured Piscinibacter sp. TaxID=1131835 RepID=UPI002605D37A|nr:glutathione peroxidase [uncultured Piscinibacter sp.]